MGLGVFSSQIGVFPSRGVSFSQIGFFGSRGVSGSQILVFSVPGLVFSLPSAPVLVFLVPRFGCFQSWTMCSLPGSCVGVPFHVFVCQLSFEFLATIAHRWT